MLFKGEDRRKSLAIMLYSKNSSKYNEALKQRKSKRAAVQNYVRIADSYP